MRILVIDDDYREHEVLQKSFAKQKGRFEQSFSQTLDVQYLSDPKELSNSPLAGEDFDAVLVDCYLAAGMAKEETFINLREMFPEAYLVAMSSTFGPWLDAFGERVGADGVLDKDQIYSRVFLGELNNVVAEHQASLPGAGPSI